MTDTIAFVIGVGLAAAVYLAGFWVARWTQDK